MTTNLNSVTLTSDIGNLIGWCIFFPKEPYFYVFQNTTVIRDLKATAYTFNLVGLIEAINTGAVTVGRGTVGMRGYEGLC
jgi:hypothetical protein